MAASDQVRHALRPGTSTRQVSIAHAHTGRQSYVYLVLRGQEIVGNVQIPVGDLNDALGLSIPDDGAEGPAALARSLSTIYDHVSRHFSIAADDSTAAVQLREAKYRRLHSGPHGIFEYRFPGFSIRRPTDLTVSFDAIIDAKSGAEALLILMESRGWGHLRIYVKRELLFDAATESHTVHLGRPGFGENLVASLREVMGLAGRLAKGLIRRVSRLFGRD